MSPTEIAIYAVETKAIIHILWGLLLISTITLVSVSIMHASLRVRLRSQKRRESHFAHLIAARAAEIKALEERLANVADRAGSRGRRSQGRSAPRHRHPSPHGRTPGRTKRRDGDPARAAGRAVRRAQAHGYRDRPGRGRLAAPPDAPAPLTRIDWALKPPRTCRVHRVPGPRGDVAAEGPLDQPHEDRALVAGHVGCEDLAARHGEDPRPSGLASAKPATCSGGSRRKLTTRLAVGRHREFGVGIARQQVAERCALRTTRVEAAPQVLLHGCLRLALERALARRARVEDDVAAGEQGRDFLNPALSKQRLSSGIFAFSGLTPRRKAT